MRHCFWTAILLLSGCVHYYPSTISTTSINGSYEKPVKVTSGESYAYYVLGFIGPIGNDSLEAAIEDAQGNAPGDTMVNVFVDRQEISFPFDWFPLVTRIKTNILGTLIKYKDESGTLMFSREVDQDGLLSYLEQLDVETKMKIYLINGKTIVGNAVHLDKGENPVLHVRINEMDEPKKIAVQVISQIQTVGRNRETVLVKR